MKKEIIQVDKERGISRITTLDERWYWREVPDKTTGLPIIDYRPSITYIGHFYPKGKGFENYLKKNGEDADILVQLAAERGSKVHQAIEALNNGKTVGMGAKFINNRTGADEELTPDEYAAVMSYRDWWNAEGKQEFRILEVEQVVWPEGEGSEPGGPMHFAGTLDLFVERVADGAKGVIDIKTSKDIYATHIIQVAALAKAKSAGFQAILQVGYQRNKNRYKFTEVPARFDVFLHAKGIFEYETEGEVPLQREFPLALKLDLPSKEQARPEGKESATENPAKGRKPKVVKEQQQENVA